MYIYIIYIYILFIYILYRGYIGKKTLPSGRKYPQEETTTLRKKKLSSRRKNYPEEKEGVLTSPGIAQS